MGFCFTSFISTTMAKGIDQNGMLRGKRGGVVYYRMGGEQISRARNFSPKNPKTTAQMKQRLMLANASKAAKGFEQLVNHSFEGLNYGVDSVRYFQSKAQATLKAATPTVVGSVSVSPAVPMDALGFPVAEFLISSGSLDVPAFEVIRSASNGMILSANAGNAGTYDITDITPRIFADLVGMNVDEQLTIVRTYAQESIGGSNVPDVVFFENRIAPCVRLNFDPAFYDQVMFDANGEIIPDVLNLEKSNNWGDVTFTIGVGQLVLNLGRSCSGFGAIVSRFENGRWRRSDCTLQIAAPVGSAGAAASLPAWGWNDWDSLLLTLQKTSAVSEAYYLNKKSNASDSGISYKLAPSFSLPLVIDSPSPDERSLVDMPFIYSGLIASQIERVVFSPSAGLAVDFELDGEFPKSFESIGVVVNGVSFTDSTFVVHLENTGSPYEIRQWVVYTAVGNFSGR